MCVVASVFISFKLNEGFPHHTHTPVHTRPPSSGVWRVPLEAACALEERRLRRTFFGGTEQVELIVPSSDTKLRPTERFMHEFTF